VRDIAESPESVRGGRARDDLRLRFLLFPPTLTTPTLSRDQIEHVAEMATVAARRVSNASSQDFQVKEAAL
jgi:hypothetical protein